MSQEWGSQARNPQGTTLEEAIDRYLKYKVNADGSAVTIGSALRGKNSFKSFCHRQGIDHVGDLDERHLRIYSEHLHDRARINQEISPSTARTYFAYVRAFVEWCVRDNLLETNPANTNSAIDALPTPKSKPKTQYWSPEDRRALLEYTDWCVEMTLEETIDVDLATAYRDRAIVYLLDGTGARGAELFADSKDSARNGVTWRDANYDDQYLVVYGKSGDFEEAPLPESIHDVLERWYRVLEPASDDWPIIPTSHYQSRRKALEDELGEARVESELAMADDETNPGVVDRLLYEHDVAPPALSKEGARRVVKQLSEEAGIDPEGDYDHLTMHGARRAIGRDLYKAGHSERAQQVLRHKSIETTHESYVELQTKDAAESIDEVRE